VVSPMPGPGKKLPNGCDGFDGFMRRVLEKRCAVIMFFVHFVVVMPGGGMFLAEVDGVMSSSGSAAEGPERPWGHKGPRPAGTARVFR
jgi:hypothetical protein